MLIVKVQNGNIEKALKQFKNKFSRVGIMKELRDRTEYTKKSVRKRNKKKHAEYVEHLHLNSEE